MNRQNRIFPGVLIATFMVAAVGFPAILWPQELRFDHRVFGDPGLIDMPSAVSAPDAELLYNITGLQNRLRNVLPFQMSPRLSASFRYCQLNKINASGDPTLVTLYDHVFDRSFALRYRFIDKNTWRPAIALGLNNVLRTRFFESTHFVATKSFGPRVRVAMGIGWGRLAGVNSFANPLSVFGSRWDERGSRTTSNTGGEIEEINWVPGDAALIGGVKFQATDRLRLIAEYSSDTSPCEDGCSFDPKTPFNFGLSYQLSPSWTLGAYDIYRSELALQATFAVNPNEPPTVPLSWASGLPCVDSTSLTIRPILRDGGARLDIDGWLYNVIHASQGGQSGDTWGR